MILTWPMRVNLRYTSTNEREEHCLISRSSWFEVEILGLFRFAALMWWWWCQTGVWPDLVPRSCQTSLHFPLRPPPHHFRQIFFCFCLWFISYFWHRLLSANTRAQIISPCQLSATPILSLIFSATRQSPFINLGKLWSRNYEWQIPKTIRPTKPTRVITEI